jgi:low temperature requirement protein LtrA
MRSACAVALAIAFVVAGVRAGILSEAEDRGPAAFFVGIAISFLIASWCWFDGRVRGKPIARVGAMLIFVGVALGYPIYCVWSRGVRGLLFLIVSALVYCCVCTGAATIASLVVHGTTDLPQ